MRKKKEGERESDNSAESALHVGAHHTEKRMEEKLIENLVELQKVHTSLAEKFDKLSEQIANLLGLFEMAARSFIEHPANQGVEKDKEFLEKVDRLLEQNKTIAKGLMLVEEKMRERIYGSQSRTNQIISVAQQQPQHVLVSDDEKKPEDLFTPSPSSKPLPKF